MKNEENRGLIHKKSCKDQLVNFFQFRFGSLSLLSLFLSLLDTQIFLGALWNWRNKGKEGKRKQRSSEERQDEASTIGFIASIDLHVYFTCQIQHAWDFMWFFYIMAWVFPGVIVFFTLALLFRNSFDEMGSHIRLMSDGWIGFEAKWGGSKN